MFVESVTLLCFLNFNYAQGIVESKNLLKWSDLDFDRMINLTRFQVNFVINSNKLRKKVVWLDTYKYLVGWAYPSPQPLNIITLRSLINVPIRLLILRVFIPNFFVFHLNKDFAYVVKFINQYAYSGQYGY